MGNNIFGSKVPQGFKQTVWMANNETLLEQYEKLLFAAYIADDTETKLKIQFVRREIMQRLKDGTGRGR